MVHRTVVIGNKAPNAAATKRISSPSSKISEPSPFAVMSSTSSVNAFSLSFSVGLAEKPFQRLSMILPKIMVTIVGTHGKEQ
ncbi:hypothetical protein TIFTF001_026590 [Ficus carica]|uniref:Uncharacterized protein n=1 Tax=Ficus carica TaxID=3494 RepID=A0AA88DLE4_FICCA|nr:hypothetical protein TIFTF001_026590 [Ficus carica]